MTLSVDPKYHPKIIGRKGAVISQIRKEHDVSVQFPDKSDERQVRTSFHRVVFRLGKPPHLSPFLRTP